MNIARGGNKQKVFKRKASALPLANSQALKKSGGLSWENDMAWGEGFASRGVVKLRDAARAFGYDFCGKVVLDIGSSTGGFTAVALEMGANKVMAVEKGSRQMREPLRSDSRVVLYEKMDIFDVSIRGNARVLIEAPDVIVADVSFLSLTKILKYAKMELSRRDTDFLVMLKPQFEALPNQLNKGVVKNERVRRDIIKDFEQWLKNNGFLIVKKRDNDLSGKHGNRERFYYLKIAG
ncbi:TlyA family rRNA (cytidine-2'-O)-methyltransferase [Candidatus Saccharibacteria bacterium]|nr:TlyA family rRNA (cytidine-2'-O)-methyltransferase [Candidatus Saccharibacteria bacterium]